MVKLKEEQERKVRSQSQVNRDSSKIDGVNVCQSGSKGHTSNMLT